MTYEASLHQCLVDHRFSAPKKKCAQTSYFAEFNNCPRIIVQELRNPPKTTLWREYVRLSHRTVSITLNPTTFHVRMTYEASWHHHLIGSNIIDFRQEMRRYFAAISQHPITHHTSLFPPRPPRPRPSNKIHTEVHRVKSNNTGIVPYHAISHLLYPDHERSHAS